jgi:hypothetical protein
MVSARLDALVHGWVSRSYLSSNDGFWADRVLSEFAFVEERGFVLDEIHFHQQGDYMNYRGKFGTILLAFFPDGDQISARASLEGGKESFSGELDRLAIERTDFRLPRKLPLNRLTIAANVRFWAEVLRSVADEFLGPVADADRLTL